MKKQLIFGAVAILLIIALFGFGTYDGIGKENSPVIEFENNIPPEDREPTINIDPPKYTCADIDCQSGYTCTLKDDVPYCIKVEELSPPPPKETIEESGEVVIEILNWDCGYNLGGAIQTCIPATPHAPNYPLFTYGYVIVPKTGDYVIETGFEPVASLTMFTASKSACDDNPYYSGVKKRLEAGKKYYFEFKVKQPAYTGYFRQYLGVFSGCFSEGGNWLESKWRTVRIQ